MLPLGGFVNGVPIIIRTLAFPGETVMDVLASTQTRLLTATAVLVGGTVCGGPPGGHRLLGGWGRCCQ